jgi:nucleoid DNA-binding protein
MTTTEIIKTLAARLKITQREARRLFYNLFTTLTQGLQKKETMLWNGFGAFRAQRKKPLRTYDPSSQEFVPLPTETEVVFRPDKRLTEKLSERRPT